MNLKEAVATGGAEVAALLGLELSGVTGAWRTESGWLVTVELVESKAVPETQDILGVYEIELDDEQMVRYERKRIRRRMDSEEIVQ